MFLSLLLSDPMCLDTSLPFSMPQFPFCTGISWVQRQPGAARGAPSPSAALR